MSGNIRIQEISPIVTPPLVVSPNSRDAEVSSLVQRELQQLPAEQVSADSHSYTPTPAEEENPLTIFSEVFDREKLPKDIAFLVCSYLPDEDRLLIFDSRLPYQAIVIHPLTSFVDFSNPEARRNLLGQNAESPEHQAALAQILSQVYHAPPRAIANGMGVAFATYPEVLHHIAKLAQDKIAVELGAATGQNAIVLAFAGAKKVYANDLDRLEMQRFRQLVAQLPRDVGSKLEAIDGSCLEILQKKPSLRGRVGLILCRNVIHFFNNQDQAAFFKEISSMLKPGGRLIISVNSAYRLRKDQGVKWFEKNADATTFGISQCLLFDASRGSSPVACFASDAQGCPESEFGPKVSAVDVYKKTINGKWKVVEGATQKLTPRMKTKANQALQTNREALLQVPAGAISVRTSYMRAYTSNSLSNLVRQHGFGVESTFTANDGGHLIAGNGYLLRSQEDFDKQAQQTGVIARLL